MKKFVVLFSLIVGAFAFFSCEDSDDVSEEPHLIVKFQFDPNQVRLNNLGQPATIPSGHAAQSPDFRKISAHYFELAPTAYTQLKELFYTMQMKPLKEVRLQLILVKPLW